MSKLSGNGFTLILKGNTIHKFVNTIRPLIPFFLCALTLFNLFSLIVPYTVSASDTDPIYWQAEEHLRNRNFDSAIQYFDQLAQRYPLKKESYFNRGLAYFHASDFEKAIADFETCMQMDNTFKDAQYMKAISLEKSGDFERAVAVFNELGDYKDAAKRIKNYRFSVYISENWYYMIAILLLVIILLAVIAKMLSFNEW